MTTGDLDRYAKMLGSKREDVRKLIEAAEFSSDAARIAKRVARAKLVQAGLDPDDPASFALVEELNMGAMRIGRVLNGSREGPVFAIPSGDSANVQHIGVFGQTRCGKTYILLHLVMQYIEAGGRCWILDAEDEYSVLVRSVSEHRRPVSICPRHLRVNFFQPPADSISWKTWLEDICLLLRQETFLRDGSLNLFAATMTSLMRSKGVLAGSNQYPSLAEACERFANLKFSGGRVRGMAWLESLNNRLHMLLNTFPETAHVVNSNMLQQLADRSVIFRLREMRGIPLQFLSNFLLTWLARYREAPP